MLIMLLKPPKIAFLSVSNIHLFCLPTQTF